MNVLEVQVSKVELEWEIVGSNDRCFQYKGKRDDL